MQFADVTGPSSFELAAVFKVWQDLTPARAAATSRTCRRSPNGVRGSSSMRSRAKRSLREIRPADFPSGGVDHQGRGEDPGDYARPTRSSGPQSSKAEKTARRTGQGRRPWAKVRARTPLLRRLAINLYCCPRIRLHPVAADKLDRLLRRHAALGPEPRSIPTPPTRPGAGSR